MNELELRQEICRIGRSLFERGYVHSTAGNISVRLPDGFLITPTEACLGFLEPEALAKVGGDGVQVSGDRASKTLALHRCIYTADANAGCVIHTHSTNLVALTLAGVWKREEFSAAHALFRDESRSRAADRISPSGRSGGGRFGCSNDRADASTSTPSALSWWTGWAPTSGTAHPQAQWRRSKSWKKRRDCGVLPAVDRSRSRLNR